MNARTTVLLILVLLLGLALGKYSDRFFVDGRDEPVFSSSGPTVAQIERLSQLVSLKVTVSDVLAAESPNFRGSWLVRGDALLGIDLSVASVPEKDAANRTATVSLPLPSVL